MTQHVAVRKDCANRSLIQWWPDIVRESPPQAFAPRTRYVGHSKKKSPRGKKMRGDDLCFAIGASRVPRSPRGSDYCMPNLDFTSPLMSVVAASSI